MKRRVLLIYPPTQLINREDRCQVPSKNITIAPPLAPMDLMYMAAVAERAGCECRIIDYTLDSHNTDDLIRDISEFKPDYLVISVTTQTINSDLGFCSVAKKYSPGVCIIAKGAHFLKFNREVLENFNDLDIIIRGETEAALEDIISGKDRALIGGITWRDKDGFRSNTDRPFIEDLDSLPFPARHLIDNNRYKRPDDNKPLGIIKVARGCPHNCFFCLATPVSGAKVRRRSPENILKEIRLCINEYGIRDFLFWSDVFSSDKAWIIKLCQEIKESGLCFKWATNMRIDDVDLETALSMRRAGCTLVSIGIESGNDDILKKIGKGIDIETIKRSFGILKKARLMTFAYYIIGLPWDTRQTVEDTIRLAIDLDSDFANFFTAVAFPGTRFFEYAKENGLFDNDGNIDKLYENAYYYPTVRSHHLSRDEITKLHKEAVRRFYKRPAYILRSFLRIRGFNELYCYFKAAISFLNMNR